jgi:cupin fold WbuC family metalloprotein
MKSSPLTRSAPGVFVTDDPIVRVGPDIIARLKQEARNTPRKRARLNTHRHMDDAVHEMLIVLDRETYVRPHRHAEKSESFHVIEGEADVVVFDDDGGIAEVIELGPSGGGRCFFYRLAEPRYHTMVIHSDALVIHETTNGPFIESRTSFAPWAPEEGSAEATAFMRGLRQRLARS